MGKVQEIIACTASDGADAEAQKAAVLGSTAAKMPPSRARRKTRFEAARERHFGTGPKLAAHRRKMLRKSWLWENGPCRRCGRRKDVEVDHIDPSQKVSHRIWGWPEERRLVELVKCQVLCKRCHKKKTKLERQTQTRRVCIECWSVDCSHLTGGAA
jgi:5-methylcytosine-specific restriction endonuclease McrA